jgi:hypothetical protein
VQEQGTMLSVFLLPAMVYGLAHTYHPLPEYTFSWTADLATSKLSVEVVVTPTSGAVGWVGFGIAGGAGGMLGGDMFTAYSTGAATCAIQDRRAASDVHKLPHEDINDPDGFADWKLDSCSLTGGVLTVAATRAFMTFDVHDLDFVSGPMALLFAWGRTTPNMPSALTFHDGGHIPKLVSLWGDAIPVFDNSTFESDFDTEIIRVNNVPIGNQTAYTCIGFNLTEKNGMATQAIAFEPLIDALNEPYVHHIVVYACRKAIAAAPFECVTMPPACQSGIIYAWGKGGNPFVLPPITGLEVGTSRTWVAMQMHYNNPQDIQNLTDSSGVRIYRTNQIRATQTGLLIMGTTQINLTAGLPVVGIAGECNTSVTTTYPLTGLNVYSSFLHAHQRGRRIWTNHVRNGTVIGTMGNNQAYDFNMQKIVALTPAVTMLPGDQFVTYCTYDTSRDTQRVLFGETTAHEMCINFMAYYPAFSVTPTMNCGVTGNAAHASRPGPNSCMLLPNEPPAPYAVTNWSVVDSFFLTGGNATCAPGFVGAAVLECTGFGAPFTFSGCRRFPHSSVPTSTPTSAPGNSAPSSMPTSEPSQQVTVQVDSAFSLAGSMATLMLPLFFA